jgi:hypothetical protein
MTLQVPWQEQAGVVQQELVLALHLVSLPLPPPRPSRPPRTLTLLFGGLPMDIFSLCNEEEEEEAPLLLLLLHHPLLLHPSSSTYCLSTKALVTEQSANNLEQQQQHLLPLPLHPSPLLPGPLPLVDHLPMTRAKHPPTPTSPTPISLSLYPQGPPLYELPNARCCLPNPYLLWATKEQQLLDF